MKLLDKLKHWLEFNPPEYGSAKEWEDFESSFKKKAPVRYFLMETLPGSIRPMRWKVESMKEWCRFRVVRYHIVDTKLKPGYYDKDTLLLNANFALLVDFVEIEKAWMSYICDEDNKYPLNWKEKYIPYYRRCFFRNAEMGIAYLEWEQTLTSSPEQATNARIIHELYDWWVNVRPTREDVPDYDYSDQGLKWGAMHDDFDTSADDYQISSKMFRYQEKLEEQWREEDTKQLIRLIKIRQSLWT